MAMKTKHSFVLLIIASSVVIGGMIAVSYQQKVQRVMDYQNVLRELQPAKKLTEIDLISHKNEKFSLQSFQGKRSFVFFGYTNCPDICPNTLSYLKQLYQQIIAQSNKVKVQIIFVSVDPGRDTVKRLAEFMPYYHKDFMGLTGDLKNIKQLTRQLGVFFSYSQTANKSYYNVDHSSSILLIDPDSRLRGITSDKNEISALTNAFLSLSE